MVARLVLFILFSDSLAATACRKSRRSLSRARWTGGISWNRSWMQATCKAVVRSREIKPHKKIEKQAKEELS